MLKMICENIMLFSIATIMLVGSGLACGDTVLTVAVLAIVITAPLGAFAIDNTYKKLLN